MQFLANIPYPTNEASKLASLDVLFREWHQHFSCVPFAFQKHNADDMVFDGFYPHYFSQKKRILFIGREARDISGFNYLELLYRAYRVTKLIGVQHLNVSKFHSRMIYIAYGIMNGMPAWQDIPDAKKIGDTFGDLDGLSFAFMNISKFSNDSINWPSDWDVINASHEHSTQARNFNREAVAILEPHIVITMNLGDKIVSLGQLTDIQSTGLVESYWLDSNGHRSLLINTWHFSAPRKKAVTDYYIPICDAIRHSEAILVSKQRQSPDSGRHTSQ
jgi:hypothetical protein